MKNKMPCENRNKRLVDYTLLRYFTFDIVAVLCIFAFLLSLFFVIFNRGELWVQITVPSILAIPVIVRSILTIRLKVKLYKNPSRTITINNPAAKLVKFRSGYMQLKFLKIKGECNNKEVTLFEYPINDSAKIYLKKEKEINSKKAIEVSIVEGTNIVNNFYEESPKKEYKKQVSSYINHSSGKAKKFSYAPINISKDDLELFFSYSSNYEELYLLNSFNKYVLITISTEEKSERRFISIDKQDIDDVNKTLDWLESNGYLFNDEAKLLAILDLNDPNGFLAEVAAIRNSL